MHLVKERTSLQQNNATWLLMSSVLFGSPFVEPFQIQGIIFIVGKLQLILDLQTTALDGVMYNLWIMLHSFVGGKTKLNIKYNSKK